MIDEHYFRTNYLTCITEAPDKLSETRWVFEMKEDGGIRHVGYGKWTRETRRHKYRLAEGFGAAVDIGHATSSTNPMYKDKTKRPSPPGDIVLGAVSRFRNRIRYIEP